jgi:HEPN domain-containing protein
MKADAKVEWIARAEEEYIAAKRLIRARVRPTYGIVCFLSQQCIEKYLKALLTSAKVHFPKTHDLIRLLDLATQKTGSVELVRDLLKPLNDYAVDVRYPGDEPDRIEAKQAIQSMEEARKFLRERLKL